MRVTRQFPPFPTAESDFTETTDWSFQTPHRERQKTSKGNMLHLQSQWATDHHRSQRKDHRLLKSHFQPEQKHLPALHKA